MNTADLLSEAQRLLQDSSYERPTLLQKANKALLEVAWAVYLPKLQATSTVTAGSGTVEVALPDIFHHSVFGARNKTKGKPCSVFYNRLSLEEYYDELLIPEGDVEAVAEEGDTLYFRLEPQEDQTLELRFYSEPDELLDSQSSIPDCIPKAFHEQIFVNFIAWSIYTEIEDDIEENRKNTQHYHAEYLRGVRDLQAALPPTSRPRRTIPRRHIWF